MADPIRFDVSDPQTPDAGPVIHVSDGADKLTHSFKVRWNADAIPLLEN